MQVTKESTVFVVVDFGIRWVVLMYPTVSQHCSLIAIIVLKNLEDQSLFYL